MQPSLFGRTGEENAVSGMEHEVAVLLVNMPSKELAELDLQLARWLEGTWQKLGKKQRRELRGRIWSALLNKAPQGDLDYDMTLNYAGGILGSILYKEMVGCIPNVSAGENPGIPSWLRPDFEKIATEDPSAKLARVRPLTSYTPACREKKYDIRDDVIPGLALAVYPSDVRSWVNRPHIVEHLLLPHLAIVENFVDAVR